MTSSRLRPGELLAAAGGVVLLGSLVMDWYALAGRRAPGGGEGTIGRNAWQSLTVLDLLLAVLAVAAIALVALNAVRRSPSLPVAAEVLTTALAVPATVFLVYRLIDHPGPNGAFGPEEVVGVEPGAYVGLVATLAVLAGAFFAMRDESGRALVDPEVELRPPPRGVAPPPAVEAPTAETPPSIEPVASPAEDPIAEPAAEAPPAERGR